MLYTGWYVIRMSYQGTDWSTIARWWVRLVQRGSGRLRGVQLLSDSPWVQKGCCTYFGLHAHLDKWFGLLSRDQLGSERFPWSLIVHLSSKRLLHIVGRLLQWSTGPTVTQPSVSLWEKRLWFLLFKYQISWPIVTLRPDIELYNSEQLCRRSTWSLQLFRSHRIWEGCKVMLQRGSEVLFCAKDDKLIIKGSGSTLHLLPLRVLFQCY